MAGAGKGKIEVGIIHAAAASVVASSLQVSLLGAVADVDGAADDHRGDDDKQRREETGTFGEGRHECKHKTQPAKETAKTGIVPTSLNL